MPERVKCAYAKSDMTPCVLKDGELARADDGACVGCGRQVPGAVTPNEVQWLLDLADSSDPLNGLDDRVRLRELAEQFRELLRDRGRLDAIDERAIDVDWLVPNSDPAVVEVCSATDSTWWGNGDDIREALDKLLSGESAAEAKEPA